MTFIPFSDQKLVTQKVDFKNRTDIGGGFQNLILKGDTSPSATQPTPPPATPPPVSTAPQPSLPPASDDAATVRVKKDKKDKKGKPEQGEGRGNSQRQVSILPGEDKNSLVLDAAFGKKDGVDETA